MGVERPNYVVDLRSDTVTMPTQEMLDSIKTAKLGDDVYGEDSTTTLLENKAAKLFGKEAGLYVPSGTMANLLAIMTHCSHRGAEAIAGHLSHTFLYEQGGAAQIAGVQLATINNETDGTFSLTDLRKKIRCFDQHEPITSLILVENTHNMCGGKVIPMNWLEELVAFVNEPQYQKSRIALHMDGARIFNASRVLKLSVADITKGFDSVSFCLSKGLSAPVGSILVGSKQFIDTARRFRKVLGGGMRQCGIIAITGIVALDTMVERLDEDHKKTHLIAEAINILNSKNFDVEPPHTNILLIHVKNNNLTAEEFAKRLQKVTSDELANNIHTEKGEGISIKASARDWSYVRVVLHANIGEDDLKYIIPKIIYVIKEYDQILPQL